MRRALLWPPGHPVVVLGPLLAGLLIACASHGPARLDAQFARGRVTEPLAALAAAPGLAPDQDLRAVELGRDARSSHHVVWIRHAEALHTHPDHDLVVVLLRGHGAMQLGDEEREVGPGSILYVPRGARHAFRNRARQPAAAYVVFHPPRD